MQNFGKKSIFSMDRKILWVVLPLLGLFILNPLNANRACAGSAPANPSLSEQASDPVCNPQVRALLSEKAARETRNEILSVQSIIWRPDSVFTMTCYDQQVGLIMRDGAQNFGEMRKTKDTPKAQKNTPFDGQVGSTLGIAAPFANSPDSKLGGGNLNISPTQPIPGVELADGQNINCDVMQRVWDQARIVQNAGNDPQLTNLKSMLQHSGFRIRQDAINKAGFDTASLFLTVTDPLSTLNPRNCHPGIPTGLMVDGKVEVVCPNPGCVPKEESNRLVCKPY
jgi:hypothetical protein